MYTKATHNTLLGQRISVLFHMISPNAFYNFAAGPTEVISLYNNLLLLANVFVGG